MKLACEIPFQYLKSCALETDFDFVLAHLILEKDEVTKEYRNYYSQIKDTSNRKMILDNGLFELGYAISDNDLLAAADIVRPDIIIAPDVLGDKNKTIERFVKFTEGNKIKYGLGGVVQGKTLAEAVECYNYFKTTSVKCILFPFGARYKDFECLNKDAQCMCSRIALIEYLTKNNLIDLNKWHHLLGSNLPYELRYLSKYNWVTSADTSIPMLSVIRNSQLMEVTEKLIRPNDYFVYNYDMKTAELFRYSIQNLKQLIN